MNVSFSHGASAAAAEAESLHLFTCVMHFSTAGSSLWRRKTAVALISGSADLTNEFEVPHSVIKDHSGTDLGMLSVSGVVANIALLGSYIADSADFVATSDGHGTIVTDPPAIIAADQIGFLTQPRHG